MQARNVVSELMKAAELLNLSKSAVGTPTSSASQRFLLRHFSVAKRDTFLRDMLRQDD